MAIPRRCSKCDINYPADKVLCPVHQEPTWALGKEDSHDKDWAEEVSRWQRRVLPGTRIPNLAVEILEKDGELFVGHDLLKAGGYLDCEPGNVVYLNDLYYELEGIVFPATDAEGWWIHEINPKGVFDDATPEAISTEEA